MPLRPSSSRCLSSRERYRATTLNRARPGMRVCIGRTEEAVGRRPGDRCGLFVLKSDNIVVTLPIPISRRKKHLAPRCQDAKRRKFQTWLKVYFARARLRLFERLVAAANLDAVCTDRERAKYCIDFFSIDFCKKFCARTISAMRTLPDPATHNDQNESHSWPRAV